MGITPDRQAGPREEEEVQFEDRTADGNPTVTGALRRLGDALLFRTSSGVVDLTAGGSGISKGTHDALRSLIHFIDNGPAEGFASGAYRETLPAADPFPTSVTWWTSSGKTDKIVEKLITYTGAFPTTIQWKVYDTDGSTVLLTVTDTISYSGPFETSRTRAIA